MLTDNAVQDSCDILDLRQTFPAPHDRAAATAAATAAASVLGHARAALPFHPDADECWAFLSRQHAHLVERGHKSSIERFAGFDGVQQRQVLSWVPTTITPVDLAHVCRDYTLEISLSKAGRATCIFAGCGFDSMDEQRQAGRDFEHALRSWFSSFELESRQKYAAFFTAGRQGR